MHLCCFFLVNTVAIYALLVCQILARKSSRVYFLTNIKSARNTQLSQSDLSHLPLWLDAARCMYPAFGHPEYNVRNACYGES